LQCQIGGDARRESIYEPLLDTLRYLFMVGAYDSSCHVWRDFTSSTLLDHRLYTYTSAGDTASFYLEVGLVVWGRVPSGNRTVWYERLSLLRRLLLLETGAFTNLPLCDLSLNDLVTTSSRFGLDVGSTFCQRYMYLSAFTDLAVAWMCECCDSI
jgi:hypothetical protein